MLFALTGAEIYAHTPEQQRSEHAIEMLRKFLMDMYVLTDGKFPLTLQAAGVLKEQLKTIAGTSDDLLMILEHAWEGKSMSAF